MSSAAATSWINTPGRPLNFTAVALNRSPYFAILRGPAFATTHLRAVSPRCQLIRGKLAVAVGRAVRQHHCHQPPPTATSVAVTVEAFISGVTVSKTNRYR